MDENPGLQYINIDSPVHRMDGLSKFLWLMVVAIGMLTFRSLPSGAVMLVLIFLVAFVGARIPLRNVLKGAPVIFGVGLLLGIFHAVVQEGNPIFTLGPISIKDQGLVIGLSYFFRIAVVVFASYLLIWTTNIQQLMVGLVKIGIPYRFAFGLFTALRFLPIIQREVNAVKAAHSIRGHAKVSQLNRRFQLWRRYVFTVMVNGLRKAEYCATAAQLRGFWRQCGTFILQTVPLDVVGHCHGRVLLCSNRGVARRRGVRSRPLVAHADRRYIHFLTRRTWSERGPLSLGNTWEDFEAKPVDSPDTVPVRLIVASDDEFCRAVVDGLACRSTVTVLGHAQDVAGLREAVVQKSANVVLLDADHLGSATAEAVRLLGQRCPTCRLFVVAGPDNDVLVLEALKQGAHGHAVKDDRLWETLPASLQAVAAGATVVSPRMAGHILDQIIHMRQKPGSAPPQRR